MSVVAYWRETGLPVWQSGSEHVASDSRSRWFFGAGPFQTGPIHDHTEFAGSRLVKPWWGNGDEQRIAKTININEPYFFPQSVRRRDAVQPAESMAREKPVDLPAIR